MPATARRTGSRSADTVLARATAIYEILTEGDLSRQELINAVIRRLGPEVYGTAPEDSLRHDLDQLERLGFQVKILPGHLYHLEHIAPRFPLPLTREHVSTLAAMRRALAGTVYGDAVEELVARVRPFVPARLQASLDREPLVQLGTPLFDDISPYDATLQKCRKACDEHQRLAFRYEAPGQVGEQPFTLDPEALIVREGHVYVEGYSDDAGATLQFRVERIVPKSVEVLPMRFAGGRRRRAIKLRYRLAPRIARLGATHRFANHEETAAPDGWVEVTGETDNLFWASKTLLRYGENCVVLEPPELVAEMKRIARAMAQHYAAGVAKS